MLKMMQKKSTWCNRLPGIPLALLLSGSGVACAANVAVDLCATSGSASLPGAASAINILGFVAGTCPASTPLSAPGGPVIQVSAGDIVTVNLYNSLAQATGLLFQGQSLVPDTTGAVAATASAYGNKTYTFTASNPGTFLYEAALLPNAEYQTAMGLYGALVVLPAAVPFTGLSVTAVAAGALARSDAAATYTSGSALVTDAAILAGDLGAVVSGAGIASGTTIIAVTDGTSFTMSAPAAAAYGASTVVNDSAVLVLSEIDPALNNSASPATFDMRNYAPSYFLINGKAYPETTPVASAAGNKVLLRYVNAGIRHHSMAVLGLRQNFVAKDASLVPALNHNVAAETLSPGQTADAIVTVPGVTGTNLFAIYDASLALHNNGADNAFGGMLTFLTAGTGAAADTGPKTSAGVLTPNPSNGLLNVALSASISSTSSTVAAAEYFIGTNGTGGSGTAISGAFGTATLSVNTMLSPLQMAALPSGKHTLYVHGKDANNKWGAFSSAALNLDKAGPLTGGLTLTPNPSNGTVSVALSATGNDSTTGGANTVEAEYKIDSGTAVAMTMGGAAAPVRSINAILPAGLAAGPHTVSVRSRDALGNWGDFAGITLNVVASAPVTSGVSVTPDPNNGARALSTTQQVVRLTATMASTGSTVSAAEAFIDTATGANGSGFPLVPSDGSWNGATELAYADIPLATINALSNGPHTLYVHGKDATGNWGVKSSATLTIDKVAPVLSSFTLTPNTVASGAPGTALAVVASDAGTGIAGGQYWIDGTATPPANATAFNGTVATINTGTLTGGTHTVYVRMQDAATNWSTVSSATLTVIRAVNDSRTITANTSLTQTSDVTVAAGVLANDLPVGAAGRTATLVSGPVRTSGTGTGTLQVTCGTATVTGVCTDGSYRVTLAASTSATTNATRQSSKRGTYTFTYTENLNGAKSTATATITVN